MRGLDHPDSVREGHPRPIRLAAVAGMGRRQQCVALFLTRRHPRFARHAWPPQIDETKSHLRFVGQADGVLLRTSNDDPPASSFVKLRQSARSLEPERFAIGQPGLARHLFRVRESLDHAANNSRLIALTPRLSRPSKFKLRHYRNCSTAHQSEKGPINTSILPNPAECAKSDRLLGAGDRHRKRPKGRFRAMVTKQAIHANLAGTQENDQDEVVRFTLQGDAKRLNPAIAAIREGTKKSSLRPRDCSGRSAPTRVASDLFRSRGEGQRSSASRKRVCRSLLPANRLRGAPPLAVISGYSARCNLSFSLIVLAGPCD